MSLIDVQIIELFGLDKGHFIIGVPGRILTTDYLTFSEPRALKKLAELKNIEVRMYRTQNQSAGFHTKGYIFEKDNLYRMIIGSSNLTMNALTKNKEWKDDLAVFNLTVDIGVVE